MNNGFLDVTSFKHALTKNRSEHLGKDVWKDFVIPRFFNKIDLSSSMSTRLEGGRGSGKTMLLRYLSYHSQFSKFRSEIPDEAINKIGLYWKADTQFLRLMQKRGVDEEEWKTLFDHYLNLKLSLEVLSSIIVIAESACSLLKIDDVYNSHIDGVKDFGFLSEDFNSVYREVQSRIRKSEMVIHNVKGVEHLEKLPASFVLTVIESLKIELPVLSNSMYSVYIDEYENLLPYQQRVINTRIKHSEEPLIFNIAIKLNGMSETSTLSDEKLENIADYAIVNLDNEITESGFDVYVAEIFLKKLGESSPEITASFGLDLSICSDIKRISERYDIQYEVKCKDALTKIFPGRTHNDLAEEIFNTSRFYNKMKFEIERALSLKGAGDYSSKDFIDPQFKKASVICASILFRKKISPDEVLEELVKLKKGQENKFTNKTSWEHNYFIGCYLRLVRAAKASSTFYSGFEVYTVLSGGNVRHFLELCKSAISLINDPGRLDNFIVERKLQHIAARNTSEELVKEIQRFTPLGNQLNNFVKGLGKVFQLCQDRESQSETEITHFGIKNDIGLLKDEDYFFLSEAEKWGVLKSMPSTKNKSSDAFHTYDYILNTIYAPFFMISYRKGRKIDLEATDIKLMCIQGESAIGAEMRKKLRLIDVKDNTSYFEQASLL
ncbi:hypothetical protein K7H09_23755 [Halomonas sp. IOP_14]|uniref:ORC-CDC6 family AAA ATPase n=1 Tax=Halomonas sp. IOP_14 TaxID=2873295 RepID=UPI001E531175|nr:hypothetical protein [Halomonas sp. IOP_14]MCD1589019.1 hypothetical protein [Halomonas sp. IOP_14]